MAKSESKPKTETKKKKAVRKEICENCTHWEPEVARALGRLPSNKNTKLSFCHRYPPDSDTAPGGTNDRFTETRSFDWCGEFKLA